MLHNIVAHSAFFELIPTQYPTLIDQNGSIQRNAMIFSNFLNILYSYDKLKQEHLLFPMSLMCDFYSSGLEATKRKHSIEVWRMQEWQWGPEAFVLIFIE